MLVSKEVAVDRARICASCEYLFQPTKTCKKCGCFVKAKVMLPGQSCPVGKWGTDKEDETLAAGE